MASLFISYSRKDILIARKLTETFKEKALDFWIDWEGIPPTVDWWQEIEKSIEEADIFLFLLSPDSASSETCRREIEHATQNGKRLVPVVVRDVRTDETPSQLRPLNWIFLREREDFRTAFDKLISAIKTDYIWAQFHRRLQVKALEWERGGYEKSLLLRGKDLQDAEMELARNAAKDPHPTDVQREYVLGSRQASDRQRRITMGIVIAAALALAALAVFGFVQAKLATDRANIALARQLAAQAQSIYITGNAKEDVAVLLAARSIGLFPVLESAQILQNHTLANRIATFPQGEVINSIDISPDGEYVVSGGDDDMVRVWEAGTGNEIVHFVLAGSVYLVSFSPNGQYILSADCNEIDPDTEQCRQSTIHVWQAISWSEKLAVAITGGASSAAFSPDNRYLVLGSTEGLAYVWEVSTGKEIRSFTQDSSGLELSFVAFTPDSMNIISIDPFFAKKWSPFTGEELVQMTNDIGFSSAATSPDGAYLVAGDREGTVIVWETQTGKEVASMSHGEGDTCSEIPLRCVMNSVAFSPDGKYVASGSDDTTARIWEISTGKEIARMAHDGSVNRVIFSPDGNYVATASEDGTARVWETSTGVEIARMTHPEGVKFVGFALGGNDVVSGGGGSNAFVWEASVHREIAQMAHDSRVNFVSFSPDSKHLISSSSDIDVWDIATGRRIVQITSKNDIPKITFSSDGKYILSGGLGNIDLRETYTGKEVVHITDQQYFYELPIPVVLSFDNKYMASGGSDNTARVWEVATGKEVARVTHDSVVSAVAFSPTASLAASGDYAGRVLVWEATTGKVISRIKHESWINSLSFSPDGKYILSASGDDREDLDNSVRVSEAMTGKEVARMTHDGPVFSAVFSPDGKYVVSGSWDHTARVWEAETGREIARMTHANFVSTVAFSPDGKFVASGGCDEPSATPSMMFSTCPEGFVRVWEAETGKEVARMEHAGEVRSIAFSPDGKYIASGSADKTVRIWIWRPEDLIAAACARVGRNLTYAEWQEYIGEALPYPTKQEEATCPGFPLEPGIVSTTKLKSWLDFKNKIWQSGYR